MKIRLWILGDFDKKICPGPGAFQKLRKVLEDAIASNGDVADIIWDDSLKVVEVDLGELDKTDFIVPIEPKRLHE